MATISTKCGQFGGFKLVTPSVWNERLFLKRFIATDKLTTQKNSFSLSEMGAKDVSIS